MSRQVTITPDLASARRLAVTLDLVDEPELSGGAGGWSEIPRPRRSAAVEWAGTPIRSQTLPLMLTGIESSRGVDASVEPGIRSVTAWGLPLVETGQPPVLTITGPVKATDGRWVLETVSWGAALRDGEGRRIQQKLTLTLLEFIEPRLLKSPAKKNHGGGKGGGGKGGGK